MHRAAATRLLELARGDDRPDIDGFVERIADAKFGHARAHLVQQRSFDGLLDEEPRAGAAHLALVEPDRVDQTLYGAIQVGVVEDNEGRLAAKLQRQALA
jgi:hypothetical protein